MDDGGVELAASGGRGLGVKGSGLGYWSFMRLSEIHTSWLIAGFILSQRGPRSVSQL